MLLIICRILLSLLELFIIKFILLMIFSLIIPLLIVIFLIDIDILLPLLSLTIYLSSRWWSIITADCPFKPGSEIIPYKVTLAPRTSLTLSWLISLVIELINVLIQFPNISILSLLEDSPWLELISNFFLHVGHEWLCLSHSPIHFLWKRCWQGNSIISSLSLNSSRQTGHDISSSFFINLID